MLIASLRKKEEHAIMVNELSFLDKEKVIFVCVGSANLLSDSIGPRIGSTLKNMGYRVLGTMEDPVNGITLQDKLLELKRMRNIGDKVVAIDLALPKDITSYNKFIFREGGLLPGSGTGKKLTAVGDYSFLLTLCKNSNDIYNEGIGNKIKEAEKKAVNMLVNAMDSRNISTEFIKRPVIDRFILSA